MTIAEPESSRDDLVSAIEDQHDDIRAVVDVLTATDDLRAVAELLVELDTLLRPHFEEEERPDGMLESIRASGESPDAVIATIRREHRELERATQEAIRAARACLDGPMAEVVRTARALCVRLQDHERRETAAFLDATSGGSGGR